MSTINEKMTALANAIRAKTGKSETLTIDEMVVSVEDIETGNDTTDATASADEIFAGETAYTADGKVTGTFTIEDELTEQDGLIAQIAELVTTKANPPGMQDYTAEDAFVTRSFTEYSNNRVTEIGSFAFYSCSTLKNVNFPKCISIGSNAFECCSNLINISFPTCSCIYSSAFYKCYSLKSANFPNCTLLKNSAFWCCSSLTDASFPICTNIGSSAFYSCSSLKNIVFTACENISGSAFGKCSSLVDVNFPNCITLGAGAFTECKNLLSSSFPVCTSVGTRSFESCGFTSIYFPVATRVDQSAFTNCKNLNSVNLPLCTILGMSAFRNCSNLVTLNIPNCDNIQAAAFENCISIENISFPKCKRISQYVFRGCYNLISADFGKASESVANTVGIEPSAFANCSKLTNLVLRHKNLIGLSNVNAFANTPISDSSYLGYFGSVYVQPSLVEVYKSATNWAAYADRIAPIPQNGGAE